MSERLTVVTALILERPLCVPCLASKTDSASAATIEAVVQRIAQALTVRRTEDRCRGCGEITGVLSIDRPR